MKKEIEIIDERTALLLMLPGVENLIEIVGPSIGPSGQASMLMHVSGTHFDMEARHIKQTSDGLEIAQDLSPVEPFESIALKLIREAALRTSYFAGDGTTTTLILASSLFIEAVKILTDENLKIRNIQFKRGIKKSIEFALESIQESSTSCKTEEKMFKVAMASSRSLRESDARSIVQAIKLAGQDGYISIRIDEASSLEQSSSELTVKPLEGLSIGSFFESNAHEIAIGNESQYSVIAFGFNPFNDYTLNDICSLIEDIENPILILLPFTSNDEFEYRKNKKEEKDRPGDILEAFLSKVALEKKKVVICTKGKYSEYSNTLVDASAFSGAYILSKYENFSKDKLGLVGKVTFKGREITLFEGQSTSDIFMAHINNLRQNKQHERLACMLEKYIKVQGYEIAEGQKVDRQIVLKNMLSSIKSAYLSGVVPGAGASFVHAAKAIESLECENEDEKYGFQVVQEALIKPLYWIARNIGKEPSSIIKELKKNGSSCIYDVLNDQYVDSEQVGILDSYTTVSSALKDAEEVILSMLSFSTAVVMKEIYQDDSHDYERDLPKSMTERARRRRKMH